MKRNFLISCVLLACSTANAQDVLITQNGDVMNVYDVEVGSSSVFYKSENKASAPVLRMDKSNVFVIKRKDGTKYDLGNGVTVNEQTATGNVPSPSVASTGDSSQMTQAAPVSEASRKRNEEIINQINSANPEYKAKDTNGRCGRLFCLLGLKPGSQMVNDDLEMSVQISRLNLPDTKNAYTSAVIDGLVRSDLSFTELKKNRYFANQVFLLKLKNKTSRTLYVDLGNTFIIRNGNASPYYIPTSSSSSSSSGSGASVNLGAVAGALGIGGALGTLAGGIGVGGGSSTGTVNTTYSQRVVSIPPMSEKSLNMQMLYKDECKIAKGVSYAYRRAFRDRFYVPTFYLSKSAPDFKNGMTHDFTEDDSPMSFVFYISYSSDETCQREKNMSSAFYLRRVVGFDTGINDGSFSANYLFDAIPDFKNYLAFIACVKRSKDDDVINLSNGE